MSLTGTLRSSLGKRAHPGWPGAGTPPHFIATGLDRDRDEARKIAVREAVAPIATQKGLDRDGAHVLRIVAVDFRITRVGDGTRGVPGMIPKPIFERGRDAPRLPRAGPRVGHGTPRSDKVAVARRADGDRPAYETAGSRADAPSSPGCSFLYPGTSR